MNKTEYLKTLVFRIKDFGKVNRQYAQYKPTKWMNLTYKYMDEIEVHLRTLPDNIKEQFYNGRYKTFFEYLELDTKSGIRFLYTNVNHVCRHLNEEFISGISKHPNANQNRCFAIKFYLQHYDRINKLMTNVLLDMVRG